MLGLSSISVPNYTTFPQSVLWAAIDLRRKKKKKKKNNNNANDYNRCLRTFGAWPLNIAASSNNGAKHYRSKLQTNGRNE